MILHNNKPILPLPYTITQRTQNTADTFTINIEPQNAKIASFCPGQFNMLYLFGVGDVPISVSGGNDSRIVHTIRAVGTVTNRLSLLQEGDTIGVSGPFGNSWPLKNAQNADVILIAGGIGLAPLRPVIYQILAERDKYNKVTLLYGVRTPEDMLYTDELEEWENIIDVQITVDNCQEKWRGHIGVVTSLLPLVSINPQNTIAMICGPEVMMHFSISSLQQQGVFGDKIFISMERNMKCAIGLCGHCQWGPKFICKDGPIFSYSSIASLWGKRKL